MFHEVLKICFLLILTRDLYRLIPQKYHAKIQCCYVASLKRKVCMIGCQQLPIKYGSVLLIFEKNESCVIWSKIKDKKGTKMCKVSFSEKCLGCFDSDSEKQIRHLKALNRVLLESGKKLGVVSSWGQPWMAIPFNWKIATFITTCL